MSNGEKGKNNRKPKALKEAKSSKSYCVEKS